MTAAELGRALADIRANEEAVTAMLAAEMGADGDSGSPWRLSTPGAWIPA